MKLEFGNVYFDIKNIIEAYGYKVSVEYDLLSVLEEYSDLVNFNNGELLIVIKDNKYPYKRIAELYKVKNGV
ncbi:hypothetical protein GCM10008027_15330 [Pseudoalteromonas gelatinilytica]|uniref:Uncharacterized protein n=2 Tax=Pseudoalteromonas gelatinilytica TaxID=1703256 RepID=A0ABQ1TFC5_9GAMM|nr:hypothetical protein GCM10008027_15330 [Pseudoalteromonas profundi]